MPTLDRANQMSLQVMSAIAAGKAREMSDMEAGLVVVDGVAHFVLAFRAEGLAEPQTFITSPLGGVLIVQQLSDLVCSHGGIVALLREAMGPGPHPAPAPAVAK